MQLPSRQINRVDDVRFENFLIAEFNEQHANMRQIESSMIQIVQYFFSLEGIIIAGMLSLFSLTASLDLLFKLAFAVFWFLFLFGHMVYRISIYAMINILSIDFQNQLVRRYFASHSGKSQYLYFGSDVEAMTGGELGDWEKVQDSRASVARFVGVVNAINLTVALSLSLYSVLVVLYPQLNLPSLMSANIIVVIVVLLIAAFLIAKLYEPLIFIHTVRREEKAVLQRRKIVLERIDG